MLSRPGMTEEKFEAILAKQVPDEEKRRLADFIIDTGQGMEAARQAVADIIEKLTGKRPKAAATDRLRTSSHSARQGARRYLHALLPHIRGGEDRRALRRAAARPMLFREGETDS